jgi:hypothetical protein
MKDKMYIKLRQHNVIAQSQNKRHKQNSSAVLKYSDILRAIKEAQYCLATACGMFRELNIAGAFSDVTSDDDVDTHIKFIESLSFATVGLNEIKQRYIERQSSRNKSV